MDIPAANPKAANPSPQLVSKKRKDLANHLALIIGCAICMIAVVIFLGFVLITAGPAINLTGVAIFIVVLVIVFCVIVGTVIFLAFSKAWKSKKKHQGEPQLKAGGTKPTEKSAEKEVGKSPPKKNRFWQLVRWSIAIVIIFYLGRYVKSLTTTDPKVFADLHPPTYVREACTDDLHTKVIPIADLVPPEDRNLPIGTKIKIPLHEGCFANTYILPANRIYWMQKSKAPGDWAAAWCNGTPEPPTQVQPYYIDMEHTMDNCYAHGREAFLPFSSVDTSPHFSLEGKENSSITFIVTAYKTVY